MSTLQLQAEPINRSNFNLAIFSYIPACQTKFCHPWSRALGYFSFAPVLRAKITSARKISTLLTNRLPGSSMPKIGENSFSFLNATSSNWTSSAGDKRISSAKRVENTSSRREPCSVDVFDASSQSSLAKAAICCWSSTVHVGFGNFPKSRHWMLSRIASKISNVQQLPCRDCGN